MRIGLDVADVTRPDGERAARLWDREYPLSLGDRLCLSVAYRLGLPAVTAESLSPDSAVAFTQEEWLAVERRRRSFRILSLRALDSSHEAGMLTYHEKDHGEASRRTRREAAARGGAQRQDGF